MDGTTENNVYHTSVYQRVPDGLTGHNYLNWGQFSWMDTNETAIGSHELGTYSDQGLPDNINYEVEENFLDSATAHKMSEDYSLLKQKFSRFSIAC